MVNAFQRNAFQDGAFQEPVCYPGFQVDAFQNDAFQVCDDGPTTIAPPAWVMVPSPDNPWPLWAGAFAGYNQSFSLYMPTVPPEEDWRLFADKVSDVPLLQSLGAPTSLGFADWRDWVAALAATVHGAW